MRKKTLRNLRFAYEIAMIVLGCFILGFGFSFFLEVNHLSTGGFSGLSMVFNYLLNNVGITFLSTSIIYFILNAILFAFAYKIMGKNFAIKLIIGVVASTIAMEVFSWLPNSTNFELIISAIYGGVLIGVGIGIVVRFGGSTGGSDTLSCIINHKFKRLSIGTVLRTVDIVVVLLQTLVFPNGFGLLPYTLIAVFICSFMLDFITQGYKSSIAYHIITDRPEQISSALMKYLKRGCTKLDTQGMYTNNNRKMLVCIISGFQARDLRNIVGAIDKNAFIYSNKVSEVLGNFKDVKSITRDEKKEYMQELNIQPKIKLLSAKKKIVAAPNQSAEALKDPAKNVQTNNKVAPKKSSIKITEKESVNTSKNGTIRQRISKS